MLFAQRVLVAVLSLVGFELVTIHQWKEVDLNFWHEWHDE
jgi:hypothetical protein